MAGAHPVLAIDVGGTKIAAGLVEAGGRLASWAQAETPHGMDAEQCVRRCVDWEAWSVEEWSAADRSTPEAITDFYRTTESWAFDLLWYAYLQAEGYGVPESVVAVRFLARRAHGPRHLDFGSGVGVTSQLFARCGYQTDLADISTSLLRFAEFRLSRRGEQARYLDLNDTELEPARYDVITALDTLAHVPDIDATAATLHASLRPGGWLITNFDVRPPSQENAWHLYDDDLGLRASVQRAGFELAGHPGELMAYRRVDPASSRQRALVARDRALLTSPPRRLLRRAARQAASTLYRLRRS